MNKILITGSLLLLSSSVFSDANIVDTENKDKTFLLTAPGTLTGIESQDKKPVVARQERWPTAIPSQQPRPYKYVGESESTRFRQFGQQSGQNNPWFDEDYSGYPHHPSAWLTSPLDNPWQVGGMPPQPDFDSTTPGTYSANPRSMNAPGMYMTEGKFYPDFPVGIYRDTNPASSFLPGKSGFMPGFGGDNFALPFSPFGMF